MPDMTPAKPEGDLVSAFDDAGTAYTVHLVEGPRGPIYYVWSGTEQVGVMRTLNRPKPHEIAAGARAALEVWRDLEGGTGA